MAEGDTSSLSIPVLHGKDDFQTAIDIMKNECEVLWKTIQELQNELKKTHDTRRGDSPSLSHSVLLDIHLAKERLLQAQIDVMKNTDPKLLPLNDTVQFEVLKDEVETSISNLKDTLAVVKSEQKELDCDLVLEQLFKSEKEQVESVLRAKLTTALEDQQVNDNKSLLNDLEQKKTKLNKYHRQLMKKLAAFVDKHFPEPSEENIKKWKSKLKNTSSSVDSTEEDVEYLSLLLILQNLLNQCIDCPHDPYITITEQFWPPYVELLVRSCIALRNPENNNKIKLMPFHL